MQETEMDRLKKKKKIYPISISQLDFDCIFLKKRFFSRKFNNLPVNQDIFQDSFNNQPCSPDLESTTNLNFSGEQLNCHS